MFNFNSGSVNLQKKIDFKYFVSQFVSENAKNVVYLHSAGYLKSKTEPGEVDVIKDLCPDHNIICPMSNGDIFNPDSVHECILDFFNKKGVKNRETIMIGFSMGARGCWDYGFEYSNTIVNTIFPMSGYGCYLRTQKLGSLMSVIVHNEDDRVIHPNQSKMMHQSHDLSIYYGFRYGGHSIANLYRLPKSIFSCSVRERMDLIEMNRKENNEG